MVKPVLNACKNIFKDFVYERDYIPTGKNIDLTKNMLTQMRRIPCSVLEHNLLQYKILKNKDSLNVAQQSD